MTSAGYAAILARLQATELRAHCHEALQLELAQVQHRMFELRAAMQRVRAVATAAATMGTPPSALTDASLQSCATAQRDLVRAISQFNAAPTIVSDTRSFVCCKCRLVEMEPEQPLLSVPDASALSPPRRTKTEPKPPKKRKLETTRTPSVKLEKVAKQEPVDEGHLDARARLARRVDECWPLASTLGAQEMRQRRDADYVELIKRVSAVFKAIHACDHEEMTSRATRSVIVKARDSLAVAVSLLNLHEVSTTNARSILSLAQAVDAATDKHENLRRHVALFRDSLAELELQLLTKRLVQEQHNTVNQPRQKLRSGR